MSRPRLLLAPLALLLGMVLSACRSTPEVTVVQGRLVITGIDERIVCFEISVKRTGVTEFGPPSDVRVTAGQATATLGASTAIQITEIRITVKPACVQQGAAAGDWYYRGDPITLPPAGEVPVLWDEFKPE